MGKVNIFGFLLVLAAAITVTTSQVYPPPVAPPVAEKEISPTVLKDKGSSSSSESSESSKSSDDTSEESSESVEDKEQMLCNVIVRATHDLHVYQSKSADQITTYLKTDCENIGNKELVEQCRETVIQHGAQIYEHVTKGMEMSQICKMIEDGDVMDLDDDKPAECSSEDGDKCRCCEKHVEKRKMRFRFIVKQMAKKRIARCEKSPRPERCRHYIRQKAWRALRKINKICPRMVCKHLGYCDTLSKDGGATELLKKPTGDAVIDSPSLSHELLIQRMEAYFTDNVCDQFEHMQTLCIQVAASSDSHRYAKIYMAILNNDTKQLDNDLQKETQLIQAGLNVDLCGACKNVIQSSKTSYLQILETVRKALDSSCEHCPAKEKCQEFFNNPINTVKTYLDSLKPDEFCSRVHLCSSSLPTVLVSANNGEECSVCVQRFQPRKYAALQAVNQLSSYFTDLCTKMNMPQCPQLVAEVVTEARSFINEFDLQETCMAMGLCGRNATHDVNDYEHDFVEEMTKEVCSTLGPFDALCQQVVQGNSKQLKTVTIDATNIDDLLTNCEEKVNEENAVATTTDECSNGKDKCQCCINRVIQKKKCAKRRVAKYVWHMIHLCRRCPAREKCVRYWEEKKQRWDAKIDKICPKKACIRWGYCTKVDTPSMCAFMGPFKQSCEQALNTFAQVFQGDHQQPIAIPLRQMSAQATDGDQKQVPMVNKP